MGRSQKLCESLPEGKFLDVNLSELGMRTGWIQFKCLVICRAQATEPKPCKPSPALVLACGNLMQLRMRILSSSWLALANEMSMSRPWRLMRQTMARRLMNNSDGQSPQVLYPSANQLQNNKKIMKDHERLRPTSTLERSLDST